MLTYWSLAKLEFINFFKNRKNKETENLLKEEKIKELIQKKELRQRRYVISLLAYHDKKSENSRNTLKTTI